MHRDVFGHNDRVCRDCRSPYCRLRHARLQCRKRRIQLVRRRLPDKHLGTGIYAAFYHGVELRRRDSRKYLHPLEKNRRIPRQRDHNVIHAVRLADSIGSLR